MRSLRWHGRVLMRTDGKLVIMSLIVVCIALPLEIIGFVTPGWYFGQYTFKGQDKKILRGIWYSINCTEGECVTFPNTDIPKLSDYYMKYQIMATISTAFGLIAVGAAVSHKRSIRPDGTKNWLRVTTFLASLISGVLAIASASITANDIIRGQGDVLRLHGKNSASFPFSCFFFGLGGLAECLATVAMFVVIVRHPLNMRDDDIKPDTGSESNEIYIFGEGSNIESNNNSSSVAVFQDNGHVNQGKEVQEIVIHPEMEVVSQPSQTYSPVTMTPQRVVYAPAHEVRTTQYQYVKPYYTELYHYPYVPAAIHFPRGLYGNRHSAKHLQILGAL